MKRGTLSETHPGEILHRSIGDGTCCWCGHDVHPDEGDAHPLVACDGCGRIYHATCRAESRACPFSCGHETSSPVDADLLRRREGSATGSYSSTSKPSAGPLARRGKWVPGLIPLSGAALLIAVFLGFSFLVPPRAESSSQGVQSTRVEPLQPDRPQGVRPKPEGIPPVWGSGEGERPAGAGGRESDESERLRAAEEEARRARGEAARLKAAQDAESLIERLFAYAAALQIAQRSYVDVRDRYRRRKHDASLGPETTAEELERFARAAERRHRERDRAFDDANVEAKALRKFDDSTIATAKANYLSSHSLSTPARALLDTAIAFTEDRGRAQRRESWCDSFQDPD